jgi:hypothetical protein
MNLLTNGRIALGVVTQLLLIGAFGFSMYDSDQQLQLLITGAIVANATAVIHWFFGSSSGSERKDEIIAASAPIQNGANGGPLGGLTPPP